MEVSSTVKCVPSMSWLSERKYISANEMSMSSVMIIIAYQLSNELYFLKDGSYIIVNR